jgi:5'-nucleotidase
LGLHLWGGADLVLSGINLGSNLGNSTWHSGTLAAAKQAVLLGTRGIALSTPFDDNEPEFTALEPSVTTVLDLLVHRQKERLLNVNIPLHSTGVLWTRQSVRHYDGAIVTDKDPKGREHFWFTVTPLEKAEPGTDRWAVENGWTSITPLRLDLTDGSALSSALQEFKHQN